MWLRDMGRSSICCFYIWTVIMFMIPSFTAYGESEDLAPMQDTSAVLIRASSVSGFRPLIMAGVHRTIFDSLALKENISLSFADVLSYNSSLFVKQYGRATLSTVSFRGTSASHTQVLWNGMKINSPMLGVTDFSLIPSFFVDKADLLHGSSSLQVASGGLGGAVLLETKPENPDGFSMQFVQGLGSFKTVDEFIRFDYGRKAFSASLRAVYSYSPNRFRYVNIDKKENVYDGNMNILYSYHPVERNENGKFRDYHILLDAEYNSKAGDRFSLSAWHLGSFRQLPRLSVDYSDADGFLNEQGEHTLRAVLNYKRVLGISDISVSAGYSATSLKYDYAFDAGNGNWSWMTNSLSKTHTLFLKGGVLSRFSDRLILRADLALYHYSVLSTETISKQKYDIFRTDADLFMSLSWKPVERAGLSLSVREETSGEKISLPIPCLNADILIWEKAGLYLKASVSRNYRYPTLNDMYFLPGGNPDLRPESGFSYDAGYSFSRECGEIFFSVEGAWFDSHIKDWILWLPYGVKKNFYTPLNLLEVHAYGIEQKLDFSWSPNEDWHVGFSGNFTWSPSKNVSGTGRDGDFSAGKQLVYVPEYSSSFITSFSYRSWSMLYKWCWYSTRYVMSSNDPGPSGSVPPYFMNDVTLSKSFDFRWADVSLSLALRNIFNENYMSVLSRPMPGINFELFLSIIPKFFK